MLRTLVAETVDREDGGNRGLVALVSLLALAVVVVALRRRGGSDSASDGIDHVDVTSEDERGTIERGSVDRVSTDDDASTSGDTGGNADVRISRSRLDDLDVVDWLMVLASGIRAMREELDTRSRAQE